MEVGDFANPTHFQEILENYGNLISGAKGKEKGLYSQVFKGMMKDLDSAIDAGVPGADTLRLARATFKRNQSVKGIQEALENRFFLKRGVEAEQLNPNQIIKDLKKDRFFGEAFNQSEQTEIRSLLLKLNKLPPVIPGRVPIGSGRLAQRLGAMTLAGGGTAAATGEPTTALLGAGIALGGIEAGRMAQDLATAMSLKGGRAFLGSILKQKNLTIQTLAQGVRGWVASQEPQESPYQQPQLQ